MVEWKSAFPSISSPTTLKLAGRLRTDEESKAVAANDFGRMVHLSPGAVLYPLIEDDIVELVRDSFNSDNPFGIAVRGVGHSCWGQAMTLDGVVVNMRSLGSGKGRMVVSNDDNKRFYVDVGAEKLWIEVSEMTMEHGLAPVSWTDYLYLTVGGTLSNAGVSGQTFRHGPQITNVLEIDVVTGKGEMKTCSSNTNSELFYAVLGGLGQFGIITRARIILDRLPTSVSWIRLVYVDFANFITDQDYLLSKTEELDFIQGSVILHSGDTPLNNVGSFFFSVADYEKIISLVAKHRALYFLDMAIHCYTPLHTPETSGGFENLVESLSFVKGLKFSKEVSFIDFLSRVHKGEVKLREAGMWDVPHPWLSVFVPKSGMAQFDQKVLKGLILKRGFQTNGPIIVRPFVAARWDKRMSAIFPEEDVFYEVGMLNSAYNKDNGECLEAMNQEILQICKDSDIKVKQYLPHFYSQEDWRSHFGDKWETWKDNKKKFDPKMILSPAQGIFSKNEM